MLNCKGLSPFKGLNPCYFLIDWELLTPLPSHATNKLLIYVGRTVCSGIGYRGEIGVASSTGPGKTVREVGFMKFEVYALPAKNITSS